MVLAGLTWLGGALAGMPKQPPTDFDFHPPELVARDICFPSGLRLHLVQQGSHGAVALAMVVGAGAADEGPELRGAAHMVEHLWFHSRDDGRPSMWNQTAGLDLQGLTTRDATVYTTVGAIEDLDRLLAIEGERLADPLRGVTEAELEHEKRIVWSEALYRGAHGVRLARRLLDAAMYPEGHPYRLGVPTRDDIEGLTLEDLRSWASEHYAPRNVTLRIEGDLESLEGEVWSQRLRGIWPAALLDEGGSFACGVREEKGHPPDPVSHELSVVRSAVRDPMLLIGWSLPPLQGDDAAWLRMSLSRSILRGCQLSTGRRASTLLCAHHDEDLDRLRQRWRRVVRDASGDAARDGWREWLGVENAQLRTFVDGLLELDAMDPSALADRALLGHFTNQVDALAPAAAVAFRTADRDEVKRFTMRWLAPDRAVGVMLVPGGGEVDEGQPLEGPIRFGLDGVPPPTWAPLRPTFEEVGRRTLDNGLRVRVVPAGTAGTVAVLARFEGGDLTSPEAGVPKALQATARYRGLYDVDPLTRMYARESHGAVSLLHRSVGPSETLARMLWIQRSLAEGVVVNGGERHATLDGWVEDLPEALERAPYGSATAIQGDRLAPGHRASRPWWEEVIAARSVRDRDVGMWGGGGGRRCIHRRPRSWWWATWIRWWPAVSPRSTSAAGERAIAPCCRSLPPRCLPRRPVRC